MAWTHKDTMAAGLIWLAESPGERAGEVMDEYAPMIEDYAKNTAPWNDRTGAARDELRVNVRDNEYSGMFYLELEHGMDYGYWLEVIQNGRFAVIMPTLETFADELFDAAGARLMGFDYL
jgi:hypothetical protein